MRDLRGGGEVDGTPHGTCEVSRNVVGGVVFARKALQTCALSQSGWWIRNDLGAL